MTNWQYTLDIKDIWEKTKDDPEHISELCSQIADRLNIINMSVEFHCIDRSMWVEDFRYMGNEQDIDQEEFNNLWAEFYDWADTIKLWVKIF